MTHKKQKTEDLRVRRTRKLLMQAMLALTSEKGFSALTVQDIADRAMVNRATFYRHYLDKYDLLDKYMNEVYDMTESQDPLPSGQSQTTGSTIPPAGIVSMFEHVQMHADFYRVMLGAKGDPAFVQRIVQYSVMRLRTLLPGKGYQLKPNSPPLDLCLNYLAHAGVGVLAWWLEDGRAYTPEQVASWHTQLNKEALERFLL
jgi:AcrR family transcriptional regulator